MESKEQDEFRKYLKETVNDVLIVNKVGTELTPKDLEHYFKLYFRSRIASIFSYLMKKSLPELDFQDLIVLRESRIWQDPHFFLEGFIIQELEKITCNMDELRIKLKNKIEQEREG